MSLPIRSAHWTRENLAWAAGLFEGEGCIGFGSNGRRSARLSIGMTDEDVLRRFHEVVGLGSTQGPYGPYVPNEKPIWQWRTARFEESQAILAALWPWLHSRRRARALEVLAQASSGPPTRQYGNKDRCGNGHPRTPENGCIEAGNWRCLICRRANDRKRWRAKHGEPRLQRSDKTLCGYGHPRIAENGYRDKRGYWICRVCRRRDERKRRTG